MNSYTESIRPAWKNPRHVIFDEEESELLSREFAKENFELPNWRGPVFPKADDDTFIEFLGVGNAINFCFTDFKTHKKFYVTHPFDGGDVFSGAFGMWVALKRAMEEGFDILDKDFLARLTTRQARQIFRGGETPIPMLQERVKNLRNIGKSLKASGASGFAEIFRDADFYFTRDGEGIVEKLVSIFDSYRDISSMGGGIDVASELAFHKRAQLLLMMYHGRAMASGGALQPLRDPEHIGPLADYEVPKALRDLGVLVYMPELAEMIDNGVVIEKESDMEIEIRAQTVHAMWDLLDRINGLRTEDERISMAELDYAVWRMGRSSRSMHHYTHTTAY